MAATTDISLQLQPRDISLMRGLFESRLMTSSHGAILYFDGRAEAAKKRLQKLKAAGYLTERNRHAFEPAVLLLTRKGLVVLQDQGVLSEYPRLGLTTLSKRAQVSSLT